MLVVSNVIKNATKQDFSFLRAMAMASAAQCTFGCEICTESFQDDLHKKVCAIPCGHVHHEKCLERWFLTQCQQMRPTNCPKCRAPATNHQMIRLFLFDTGSDSAPASHNTNHNNTANMIQHDPVILDESDNENTDEVIVISDSEANNSDADSSDEDVAMVVFGERNLRNNNVAFDVDFNLEL